MLKEMLVFFTPSFANWREAKIYNEMETMFATLNIPNGIPVPRVIPHYKHQAPRCVY